jgi:hypothetical protein
MRSEIFIKDKNGKIEGRKETWGVGREKISKKRRCN